MKPAFTTKRLNVFRMTVVPNEIAFLNRLVFVGFLCNVDVTRPSVIATVTPGTKKLLGGAYLEWIETVERFRRQGLAREMICGIQESIRMPLVVHGATPEGKEFCAAMEKQGVGGAA